MAAIDTSNLREDGTLADEEVAKLRCRVYFDASRLDLENPDWFKTVKPEDLAMANGCQALDALWREAINARRPFWAQVAN